jgi:hypothetical protein
MHRQELPHADLCRAAGEGIERFLSGGRMSDIEILEAQLAFLSLEARWAADRRGDIGLMRELESAEDRLISLFMNGWSDHATMSFAYSHYRRARLRCVRNNS